MLKRLQNYLLNRSNYKEKITLTNKKIYILPTKAGLFFSLIQLLMLLTAINFNNSLIYFLTFFLASITIVSMLFTQKCLLGLSFQTGIAVPVFCKQTAMIPLTCSKSKSYQSLPASLSIKFTNLSDSSDANESTLAEAMATYQIIDLIEQQQTISLAVNTQIRGYIKIPPITVSSTFPFGLFYAWSTIKLSNQSLVYPQPLKSDTSIQLSQLSENSFDYDHHKGLEDFSGLDKFISGQSLKQVHWKAYAKQQGLYIKTFSGGSKSDKYWFDIEQFENNISLEQRLSYLTYFIIQADKNGDRYGLKMYQQTIAINSGSSHKHQCLKTLALFSSTYSPNRSRVSD
jgi:Protein of unknown function DUF58